MVGAGWAVVIWDAFGLMKVENVKCIQMYLHLRFILDGITSDQKCSV